MQGASQKADERIRHNVVFGGDADSGFSVGNEGLCFRTSLDISATKFRGAKLTNINISFRKWLQKKSLCFFSLNA